MPKITAYTYDEAVVWNTDDVGEWLRHLGFHEFVEPFEKYNINGKNLFELSENRLQKLYPNMPTGKSDPASMLWKQINKVKENRKTGKKSKIPFSGWGSEKKQPPKAPEPDYNPNQQYREPNSYDQGSEDEEWDSDFSNEDEGAEYDQKGDMSSSQGNPQGRSLSYNSSTSSFTNLSSSASGKDDDSSLLYLAPNAAEGDYNQTYEVPSEQMNSSYGDGDCDEIYDVPHDEDQSSNSLQPDTLRRHGRSASPQPTLSPRHEALRPLPTLPHTQLPHWQQQQQQQVPPEPPGRPSSRQIPPTSQRPPHSPHHYPRPAETSPHEEEEQENYEVPHLDQPNYEAPLLETQDNEDEAEEEYLVPVPEGSSYKSQQTSSLPQDLGHDRPFMRPPAPLPSVPGTHGIAPPRPVKPPDLVFTTSEQGRRREVPVEEVEEEDCAGPPPIPSRPAGGRTPVDSNAGKGFSKLLPDPPPHVIREAIISRPEEPSRDKSPVRPAVFQSSANGRGVESNFGQRAGKVPPPLPTNSARDFRMGQERDESTSPSPSPNAAIPTAGTVAGRLKQWHRPAEEAAAVEASRPALAPRPSPARAFGKPAQAARPSWARQTPTAQEQTPPSLTSSPASTTKWTSSSSSSSSASSAEAETPDKPVPPPPLPQAPAAVPQRPTPRPRQIPDIPAAPEPKPMPSIPTKEPPKIKKYTVNPSRTHQETPKQEKSLPPPEPEKARPSPKQAKPNDMTGYPWYDADLKREEAAKILKQTKMDGAFVVRDSIRGDVSLPYSLSLWYSNKVRNLQIRLRPDGKYALGTYKENEQVFDSAVLLIQYHMTNPLILAGDVGKTCLKVAAPNFR